MDAKIDYSKVASATSHRMAGQLADAVFELEQWKELASNAIEERDKLRAELDAVPTTDEQK